LLRGEAELGVPIGSFVVELGLALRPHFFALSAIAALAGSASVASSPTPRIALGAFIAGLGWGVGQLVNDLLDRETDVVNAPDRAIVAERLPAGPALACAAVLGVGLAVATVMVHSRAWVLALAAALLIVFYNGAKSRPLLGNIALALLMAIAAAIGALAALGPEAPWSDARGLRSTLPLVGAIAAWYLQSNYEKDRTGDRAAGYRTLAVLLSVRQSAIARALSILAIAVAAHATASLADPLSQSTMLVALLVGLASTLPPILQNSDESSLRSYVASVVASILAMLSLSAPLLGRWGTTVLLILSLSLVSAAFRRSPNP
jgi:4-hydroxybenzoate polyprenyltransferase